MSIFNLFKKKETSACCTPEENCCDTKDTIVNENGEEMAECDCGNMCPVSEIEAKKAATLGCCGDIDANSIAAAKESLNNGASIKVLGSGCKKCSELEIATKEALASLNMDTSIDKVTEFSAIASYGVMTTPALVVDGKVVSYGKVLKTSEVVELLKKARA